MPQDAWDHFRCALGEPTSFVEAAGLLPEDVTDAMKPSDDGVSLYRPTPVDRSRAIRWHRACKIKCNFTNMINAPPSGMVTDTDITLVQRKRKLSTLVDSTLDADIQPLEPNQVRDMFATYRKERGEYPHEDHEPTPCLLYTSPSPRDS